MFNYETEDEKPKVKWHIKIIPFKKTYENSSENQSAQNHYDISNLMMLID